MTIISHSILFGWDNHKRCSPPRPPHQHLRVIGVRSPQRVGRDGFLIVEDVRLFLVGRTRQGGSRAQRHIWVHCNVHPHSPAHGLQHDTLLEESRVPLVWKHVVTDAESVLELNIMASPLCQSRATFSSILVNSKDTSCLLVCLQTRRGCVT